jgi:hypothetical protein
VWEEAGGIVEDVGDCQAEGGEVREERWHCGFFVDELVIGIICIQSC